MIFYIICYVLCLQEGDEGASTYGTARCPAGHKQPAAKDRAERGVVVHAVYAAPGQTGQEGRP